MTKAMVMLNMDDEIEAQLFLMNQAGQHPINWQTFYSRHVGYFRCEVEDEDGEVEVLVMPNAYYYEVEIDDRAN